MPAIKNPSTGSGHRPSTGSGHRKARVVVFCAPSGSGKTTLVHSVLEKFDQFSFSVSATNRERRGNEIEGKDYYFLSSEEFLARVKRGEFLEWEEVYPGRYYGTLKKEVERILAEGKNILFDVDVMGGISIKEYFGDLCLAIFIKPPSIPELKRRLEKRGTDSAEEIARRIKKASREMVYAGNFDCQVTNDDLEKAKIRVEKIVKARVH